MPGGRVKRCGYISLGYCGWHTTWEGKKVFLRSTKEFIFARTLDLDKVSYDTEVMSYRVKEKTYKPDFFIYETGFLKKIVEIKGNKTEGLLAENLYGEFFRKTLKINYEVLWKFDSLISKYSLEKDVETWIETSIHEYNKIDYRGKNNPRYGQHCSDDTKRKIGERAKKRFEEVEYRNNISNKVKESMSDPETAYARYRRRIINFARKIMQNYNIQASEVLQHADFYKEKAKQDKVLLSNAGFSKQSLDKYDIKEGDLSLWEN